MMIRLPFLKALLATALAGLLLLTAGCLGDRAEMEIPDLQRMPQDLRVYLDPATAAQPLIAGERQAARAAEFLRQFFAAWQSEGPLASTHQPFWAVDWITENVVYGENLRPAGEAKLRSLIEQADRATYPSDSRRAITVRRADLRALPTSGPLFNDPQQAGQGFPFDHLQHAALAPNTPLLVTHLSKDRTWAFVETPLVYGWLPLPALAWVDETFARSFVSEHYVTLTHDKVPLFDSNGTFRFRAGIGTLLPLMGSGPEGYRVRLAAAGLDRRALLTEGLLPTDRGEVFPLPLTTGQLAGLANRMIGQPYAWGDSFSGRDCSGTLRDLFAPFGLWLPRNSAQQARIGRVIALSDLPPVQREQRLLAEGIPFLTLVRLPGHIMLYIGEHEGRAALLHTLWGLRTDNLWGREGRWIVGRTVVTTLDPGRTGASLGFGVSKLLNRVASMNLLAPLDEQREPADQ